MKEIKNNEHSICAECNGACCRGMGCELHPKDVFGEEHPTIERLVEFLSCGFYQIDYWDGDIREHFDIEFDYDDYKGTCYYLRAKHTNSNSLLNGSWGGTCVLFEDGKGCKLSWEQRPYGGKALIPNETKKCHSIYGKAKAALDWLEYRDLVIEALDLCDGIQEEGTFSFIL